MIGEELGEERVALVTGANKGIGFAIAQGLGELGYTVAVGARDPGRGKEATALLRSAGVDAFLLHLDVCDEQSVARAAAELAEHPGRLDVLVNNAAVKLEWHPAPPSASSLRIVRETYETNVFGSMSVLLAMLPLLRRSPAGRIVNVSSGLGSSALAAEPGSRYAQKCMLSYNTSKAALNSVTIQFANELRNTPVKVNAADPGFTRSDMTHNEGNRMPADGARVVIELATLPPDGPTGGFFDDSGPLPW